MKFNKEQATSGLILNQLKIPNMQIISNKTGNFNNKLRDLLQHIKRCTAVNNVKMTLNVCLTIPRV